MSNIFSGIYSANDALTAARYGLEVTGQNIANANTPGYTRQAAQQVAVGTPVGVPTLHSGTIANGGVRATGATRLGDAVLDTRTRAEHARSAQVDTSAARLSDLENIFNEPSDNGLANQLGDFWSAWGDVANDPGAQVPRQMLIASAQSTVTMLHSMNSSLDSVATAAQNSLDAQITAANTAASSLSDLNRKIAIGTATGANINALLDQRDVLLDQLSTSVGGVATVNSNGTASVTVGGQPLVTVGLDQNGQPGGPPFAANGLKSATDASGQVSVNLTNADGEFVDSTGAVIADQTDPTNRVVVTLSDSTAAAEQNALNVTVPHYRDMLDDVAKSLAKTVNDVQSGGFDLNGATGAAMFTDGSVGTSPVTAANITVALSGSTDWQKVAAAGSQPQLDGDGNPVLDGDGNPMTETKGALDASNALSASLLGSTAGSSGPDTTYSLLVGDLGRASASAQQQQSTQQVITSSVDTLKSTTSGVSYDEEVSNMLTYQMAFQASSRVLTTLDSMLDTLINHTGLVGQA